MPTLELWFESGEDSLEVRRFSVREAVSGLFAVEVMARSPDPAIDLEAIVGRPARLLVVHGMAHVRETGSRVWGGICNHIQQVQGKAPLPGEQPLSTYEISIVPAAWVLTQRRNYRIFQRVAVPDIADSILGEWGIDPVWKVDREKYPKLDYKVQYGETDWAFFCRILEEAGIAFHFPDDPSGTRITLSDQLHREPRRGGEPIVYVDNPNQAAEKEFVTNVHLSHEVRPGAYTIRDHDFRKPAFPLFGKAPAAAAPEDRYEQYHYQPGGFLIDVDSGAGSPTADDKAYARHEEGFGKDRAARGLLAERNGKRSVAFETNVIDLGAGVVFGIEHHPHPELGDSKGLLITSFSMHGAHGEEWHMAGTAVFTDVDYRPPIRTPKPEVSGLQSAIVVGPRGQEIYTDEFGRVRVQFPWDRYGQNDDNSSCWIRVSQGWAGTGYGMMVIPRVDQEVLVGFLEGDPDQPVIVGRVYNATNRVPHNLPEHKTRSTWKSNSSPGSDGFNEIMFEDKKGEELVWEQAQRNRRRLVKNDEVITVAHDRQKLVKHDELDRTLNDLRIFVGRDQDIVIKQDKRERVEGNSHLRVNGKRNQKVYGSQSLTVKGDRHELVGKNHALAAGDEIHLQAGTGLVIEASRDLTLKGPGGFIRIDGSGITIRGKVVKINSGGSPGQGKGASPEDPAEAVEAVTDDVSKTLIGQ